MHVGNKLINLKQNTLFESAVWSQNGDKSGLSMEKKLQLRSFVTYITI